MRQPSPKNKNKKMLVPDLKNSWIAGNSKTMNKACIVPKKLSRGGRETVNH